MFPERNGRARLFQLEERIERALAVAFQIERDECESCVLQPLHNLSRELRIESTSDFLERELDSREFAVGPVGANAKLPKSQFAKNCLTGFDFAQQFGGYWGSIRNARGKASRRGAVPRRKFGMPRKQANFVLVEAGVQQRSENAVLVGGAMAGAKIVRVVRVYTICNRAEILFRCDRFHPAEQFVFAEIAAVGIVRYVKRILKFVGLDEFMPDSSCLNKLFRLFAIVSRKAGGEGSDRERSIPNRLMRRPREIRGISAARKGDQQ